MTIHQGNTNLAERRKHTRFIINGTAYAACWPDPVVVGEIIDISKFGISFIYPAEQSLPETISEVAIIISGASFVVKRNPFQSVSDIEVLDCLSFSGKMRRHSGYFINPTPEHDQFIKYHTVGEV